MPKKLDKTEETLRRESCTTLRKARERSGLRDLVLDLAGEKVHQRDRARRAVEAVEARLELRVADGSLVGP